MMINPMQHNSAQAAWNPGDEYFTGDGDGDNSDDTEGDTNTNTALTIILNDNASMQTLAETDHAVTMSTTFQVTAVDTTEGYHIAIQSANGYSSNLIGKSNPTAVLTGVGDKIDTESFPLNTWGYAMTDQLEMKDDELKYSTLPSTGNTLTPDYSSGSNNEEKTFKLAFAARFGNDLPADHYQTNVMISAVANAETTAGGFKNITFMQDMTPEICHDTTEGYAKQLQDTRDNKWYWVTKLKDGNCWMTQNLDYNPPSGATDILKWPANSSIRAYYDPGDFIYTTPTEIDTCNPTKVGLSDCAKNGWVQLTNNQYPSRISDFPATPTETEYNAHYHIGNYYSWLMATSNDASSSDNTQGICPDGANGTNWVLPTSDRDNTDTNGSFSNLLSKYGLTNSLIGVGIDHISYNIQLNPLYFLRGGHVYSGGDPYLTSAGNYGYYWSSTPVSGSSKNSYYLELNTGVTPYGNTYDRAVGDSVRCLFKSSQ